MNAFYRLHIFSLKRDDVILNVDIQLSRFVVFMKMKFKDFISLQNILDYRHRRPAYNQY